LFSYLFAFILFWCIAVVGFPYPEAIIGKVKEGYPAQRVGLKEGDKILEVNAKSVGNWLEMTAMIRKSKSKVSLKVERDGESLSLDVPLEEKNINDEFGAKRSVSVIGIEPSTKIKIVRYNLFKGFFKGLETLFGLTFVTFKGFIFMILGKIPLKEAVTGPLGIYYLTSETVKMGISALMYLMAVLNISLFVVNLIPAPLLDGFHILVFFIEKIRKKQLSEKTEDFFARLGYVILGVLIIFVFYNDFVKFGPKFWGK
jgi:regulator of sigma E protease